MHKPHDELVGKYSSHSGYIFTAVACVETLERLDTVLYVFRHCKAPFDRRFFLTHSHLAGLLTKLFSGGVSDLEYGTETNYLHHWTIHSKDGDSSA